MPSDFRPFVCLSFPSCLSFLRELEADESYIIIYLKDQKILVLRDRHELFGMHQNNQPQQVFETSREWQEKVQQKKKTSDQGVVTYFLV